MNLKPLVLIAFSLIMIPAGWATPPTGMQEKLDAWAEGGRVGSRGLVAGRRPRLLHERDIRFLRPKTRHGRHHV